MNGDKSIADNRSIFSKENFKHGKFHIPIQQVNLFKIHVKNL